MTTHEDKQWEGGMLDSFASFAFLDPYYTKTLPMTQVVSGAFDTLSHCYETYLGSPRVPNLSDQINESVMRVVIKNMRKLKVNEQDFQVHQIEHRLGAYTDCNHDQGLAVIHPVLYRHMVKEGLDQFARFAKEVWKVDDTNKTKEEVA